MRIKEYNRDFKRVQFDTFRNEASLNRFTMTPQNGLNLHY